MAWWSALSTSTKTPAGPQPMRAQATQSADHLTTRDYRRRACFGQVGAAERARRDMMGAWGVAAVGGCAMAGIVLVAVSGGATGD